MSFASTRWLPKYGAMACLLLAMVACSDDDDDIIPPPPPPPPALVAPTGLTGTATSTTGVRVTWSAVTGATSYTVEQATGSGAFSTAGTVSGTEFTAANLQPNTEYRFRVRGLRGTEQGPFSADVTVRTQSDAPVALVAPTGVGGSSPSATSVRVVWNPVASATAYDVQQATLTGDFVTVNRVTGTDYTATGLAPTTDYRFRVRSVRNTETSDFSAITTIRTLAANTIQVSSDITQNTVWTSNNIYQLTRIISVANGATLTIQPGTRIIGGAITQGQAPPVTALIVLRGSRVNAVGTAEAPIVMTSAASEGNRFPGDWGGLIIVGNARSNRTGRVVVEGPAPADTISWGNGNADNDNSGDYRYIRVEFAGAAAQLNVELNSFSMYSVGSGTRMEYLQAIRGLDDMFEWFGGTVDGRYFVSYESGDDHFDSAEGYRGRNQFMIALQTGPRISPRPGNPGALSSEQSGFENDGCGSAAGSCAQGFNSTPYSMPVFANFTVVGPGPGVLPVRAGGDGGLGANIRRGTGGVYINGVLARWPEAAFSIFDPETDQRITEDSLNIRNLVLADNPRNFDAVGANNRFGQESKFTNNAIRTTTAAGHTLFNNVPSASTPVTNNFDFDWRPATGSILATGGTGTTFPGRIPQRVTNFFGGTMQSTSYVGAIDPAAGTEWYAGWTRYYLN